MLGDAGMAAPTVTYPALLFPEDDMTKYQTCWTGANVVFNGQRRNGTGALGPYEHLHPRDWPGNTGESYRRCCTSIAWVGQGLAMRLLQAQDNWNHPAYFDYVDRWMFEDDTEHIAIILAERGWDYSASYGRQGQTWDQFVNQMWATYRYADVYPPLTPTGLQAGGITDHSVTLSWTAPDSAGDGDYASYYLVFRDGKQVGFSRTITYTDRHLAAGTQYSYQVYSVDDEGNTSQTPAATTASTSAVRLSTNLSSSKLTLPKGA